MISLLPDPPAGVVLLGAGLVAWTGMLVTMMLSKHVSVLMEAGIRRAAQGRTRHQAAGVAPE